MSPLLPLWGVIIGLALIAINGWFAAARKSISEANKAKIREMADENNKKANSALLIIENAPGYKLTLRVFNVFIYMLYCAVCMSCLGFPLFIYITENLQWDFVVSGIAAFIAVLLISQIVLIALGEIFPRKIAVQHAEGVLTATADVTRFMSVILKPLTVCMQALAFLFLKIFRQRSDVNDNEYSEDEIVEMLEAGQESGELKEEGKKMITGVFAFDDILAYEIMTPRTDVFAIDVNAPVEDYIDELMELRYSRIPVYEEESDNIIGILYIKDYLIKAREDGFENVDIKSILRTPYFVPETKNIDSLFFELQKTKQHITILIDEYGGFCGIVTMEDIIEEVMGDIDDEYDQNEEEIKKAGKDRYIASGSMNLDDLNEELGIDLESEDSETIGGFIIDMFGEIPDEKDIGKEIAYEDILFTIKSVKDRRIELIEIKLNRKNKEQVK